MAVVLITVSSLLYFDGILKYFLLILNLSQKEIVITVGEA